MKVAPSGRSASLPAPPGPQPVTDWTEITVTARCNQRCFFCYESKRRRDPDPPFEQIRKLIEACPRHSQQIVFCGREALLRPDIFELVAYARRRGLRPVVFTNGQALHRAEVVSRLAEAGCSAVAISFHFPDAATLAFGARVSPRQFEHILQGLRNLRDHNHSFPEQRIGISTETDMFSLNAGRLQDMRRTLLAALGDNGWSMRLAGLVPMEVHDIGLPTVVDSMDERREEVAEFLRTHPPGVPLEFVKVPLCLLPEGEEHRSLDVRYIHQGTRMTFNHLEVSKIEVDRISVTKERHLEDSLRRHPYRWLCRTCALLGMCRFERLSWHHRGFLPDRANRPRPYLPQEAPPGILANLDLPRRTASALEVLSRLGPTAGEHVTAVIQAVPRQPFPEEEILQTLLAASSGEPLLKDVWCEKTPLLALQLALDDKKSRWAIVPPGVDAGPLAAIVDYLAVRPLEGEKASDEWLRPLLRRLASRALPEIERWSGDVWFSLPTAKRRRLAWRTLGEVLWVGLGHIGPWRTISLRSEASSGVEVTLRHPRGSNVELCWLAEESGADIPLHLSLRKLTPETPAEDVVGLFAWLLKKVHGNATRVPRPPAAGENISFQLYRGDWTRTTSSPSPEAAENFPREDELVLRVRRGANRLADFHIVRTRKGRPVFFHAGNLSLWHEQKSLDGPAKAWAQLLLKAIRHQRGKRLCAASLPAWRKEIAHLVERAPWAREFTWQLEWRPAVRSRTEKPRHE